MCGPHLGSEVGGPGEPPRGSTNGSEGGARRNKRRKEKPEELGDIICKYDLCTGV